MLGRIDLPIPVGYCNPPHPFFGHDAAEVYEPAAFPAPVQVQQPAPGQAAGDPTPENGEVDGALAPTPAPGQAKSSPPAFYESRVADA